MVNFLLLIILHLLGDFYLQTTKVARCKNAIISSMCEKCKKCKSASWINWKYLIIHSVLYIVPFSVMFFIMKPIYATMVIVGLLVTHILIDAGACYFNKKIKQTIVFIVDQALHVGILFSVIQFVIISDCANNYLDVLKVIFLCLTLVMPCSIVINKLFKDIYPDTEEMGIFDVGSMIGIMERILTVIFAYFGNFPAIAIIITVKTWARTNDLKEPEFRNKYLLGTLTSLVLALLIFIVYKSIE